MIVVLTQWEKGPEMPEDAEQVKSINIGGKKSPRSWGVKHRLLTLEQLDRRTNAARRVHEIIDAIHLDLGGEDQLATGSARSCNEQR